MLPSWLRYTAFGLAQCLVLAATLAVITVGMVTGLGWLGGATTLGGLYGRAVVVVAATASAMTVVPILTKWVLVGRWRRSLVPLWSPAHLRLWTVATLTRLAPPVALAGSPLYSAYLRALGARVGAGAVIFSRSLPVCTDTLTVGPGAMVGRRASLTGYRPGRDPLTGEGLIQVGTIAIGADATIGDSAHLDVETTVGDRAQLVGASTLLRGQEIPAGEYWHGSPARRTDAHDQQAPPAACPPAARARYAVGQLLVAQFGLPVPITVAGWTARRHPQLVALLDPTVQAQGRFLTHAASSTLLLFTGGIVLALAVVLTVPRLLAVLVVPGRVYPLYGLAYCAHRAVSALTNAPFLIQLYGDSSYITGYLRALGYRAARDHQTGTNVGSALHHETPYLITLGAGTQISDGVGFATAAYSSSSFRTRTVTLGRHSFLGNAITLPPGLRMGDGCFLGTKTLVPVGTDIGDGVGLLGSPAFPIPAGRARPHAGLTLDRRADLLAAKNRHNLGTIGWFLVAGWARLYLAVVIAVPTSTVVTHRLAGPLGGPVAGSVGVAVAGVATGIAELAFGIGLERAAAGFAPLRPRRCSIYHPYFWFHERFWKLSGQHRLLRGTTLKPLLTRLLGASVGRRVFDDGAGLTETSLVIIGDGVILGAGTTLQAHSMEDGEFKSDRIRVRQHALLAPGAFVHYGTDIGPGATIAPDSFVMKGEAVPAATTWAGNPAGPAGP